MMTKTSIKLALDPSFTGMGVLAFSEAGVPKSFPKITPNGKMGFAKLKVGVKVQGGFEQVAYATMLQETKLRDLLSGCTVSTLITETPPPFGTFAAGLYALDCYLVSKNYLGAKKYLIPPSAINGFFGVRKPKKSFITAFVTRQLGKQAIRLNHDEASAYLLMWLWAQRMKGITSRPTIYKMIGSNEPSKV